MSFRVWAVFVVRVWNRREIASSRPLAVRPRQGSLHRCHSGSQLGYTADQVQFGQVCQAHKGSWPSDAFHVIQHGTLLRVGMAFVPTLMERLSNSYLEYIAFRFLRNNSISFATSRGCVRACACAVDTVQLCQCSGESSPITLNSLVAGNRVG